MEPKDIDDLVEIRKSFRRVFTTAEGKDVLALLLNELGYFAMNPEIIHPERIAMANWILGNIGVIHPTNLFLATDALAGCANDKDLEAIKADMVKGGTE